MSHPMDDVGAKGAHAVSKRSKQMEALEDPKTAEQMISHLRRFFTNPDVGFTEKGDVWEIMGALRGPDEEELAGSIYGRDAKLATTAVLRYALYWDVESVAAVISRRDTKKFAAMRRRLVKEDRERHGVRCSHFIRHAQRAFKVLGLTWNSANKMRPRRRPRW